MPEHAAKALPYRIACLCDLRDARGRVLLLDRAKSPNLGLSSPIGGKLEMDVGESPAQCAQREIMEEAGIHVPIDRLHLGGMISEVGFEGECHWLLFYYRVLGPVELDEGEIAEGTLRWHEPDAIDGLKLAKTDRQVIWPLIRRCDAPPGSDAIPGFFAVHIDCTGEEMAWEIQQIEPSAARVAGG